MQDDIAKNATPLGLVKRVYPFAFKICLATIGVAFLSAATSVAALFYFIKKEGTNMKRALSLILVFVLCLSLCACGNGDGETEVETEKELVERVACTRATASLIVKYNNETSGAPTAKATYSKEIGSDLWEVSGTATVKDKYNTPHTYKFDATVQYNPAANKASITEFKLY